MTACERTDDANQPEQHTGQAVPADPASQADRADRADVEPTTIEQRWRLALGVDARGYSTSLSEGHRAMDAALADLYDVDPQDKERGGLGGSAPHVARWLGDIRKYFPSRVVRVMQTDAIDRLGLTTLLLEPEVLQGVEPDVHLAATLATLSEMIPQEAKATARTVVDKVVKEVEERIADRLQQSVRGALDRSRRTSRPQPADIDWNRTIAANLKNYVPDLGTVIPERLVGHGRRHRGIQKEFTICMDQSGSMSSSVIYASIMAAVMASIRSLRTTLVAYDTAVTDLTPLLSDPVDVIFGTQLGGGTNTSPAIEYCRQTITRPADSVFILISDLYDSDPKQMLGRVGELLGSGMQVVVLLALSDDGVPSYNHDVAKRLAAMGVPAFGCTPDAFPGLLAAAIHGEDLGRWADEQAAAQAEGA